MTYRFRYILLLYIIIPTLPVNDGSRSFFTIQLKARALKVQNADTY